LLVEMTLDVNLKPLAGILYGIADTTGDLEVTAHALVLLLGDERPDLRLRVGPRSRIGEELPKRRKASVASPASIFSTGAAA